MPDLESLAEKLRAQLAADSPEQIVKGLYQLVLMQDSFNGSAAYRATMKVMVNALWVKLQREA
jgi:hypothetical protein